LEYKSRSTGCLRLFILPHTLVGIGVILIFLSKVSLGLFGTKVEARLVEKTTSLGTKGRTSYQVRFSFAANHERSEGSSQVPRSAYDALPEQGRVPIIYLSVAPQYFSDYLAPNETFPAGTWALLGFALFWNAVVGVFVYAIYIGPWLRKRLVIFGSEAEGKVTTKHIRSGSKGGLIYEIRYNYEVQGETFSGKESTMKPLFDTSHEGDSISVTFDPKKPKRALAVAFSEWEVVS
jgi:hypothetical protein